jgi:invasion protein IalB
MVLKGFGMSVSTKRMAAMVVAGSMLGAGAAVAQTKPAPRPARPAAPAAQPAQPAPAPAPAQQQQQPGAPGQPPQGPVRAELQPLQPEWTKVCGNDPADGKQSCYTTRDFGDPTSQTPQLAVLVTEKKGDDSQAFRLVIPPGFLLRPGFRFFVDKGGAMEGYYTVCLPNGCLAEAAIKNSVIDTIKKGTNLTVMVKNGYGSEVNFVVPLAGFGKAFDGPPIDPKVLEAQQKAMQEEMQRRADEERKRLESLNSGASGAAPAPAAPAPAAPH